MDLNDKKDNKVMLDKFEGYADRYNLDEAKKLSAKLKSLGEQFETMMLNIAKGNQIPADIFKYLNKKWIDACDEIAKDKRLLFQTDRSAFFNYIESVIKPRLANQNTKTNE